MPATDSVTTRMRSAGLPKTDPNSMRPPTGPVSHPASDSAAPSYSSTKKTPRERGDAERHHALVGRRRDRRRDRQKDDGEHDRRADEEDERRQPLAAAAEGDDDAADTEPDGQRPTKSGRLPQPPADHHRGASDRLAEQERLAAGSAAWPDTPRMSAASGTRISTTGTSAIVVRAKPSAPDTSLAAPAEYAAADASSANAIVSSRIHFSRAAAVSSSRAIVRR